MSSAEDESGPFEPTLTQVDMPGVEQFFNQGMLNIILDRIFGTPARQPREHPFVGLFTNLVRLTDKALREYDAARFELIDYLLGRQDPQVSGARTSPYIRAVDHMENVVSAVVRAMNSLLALRRHGYGHDGPRLPRRPREVITSFRDMMEHADDRLTMPTPGGRSRRQLAPDQPYALRLENKSMTLGDLTIRYEEVVQLLRTLYLSIEDIRGAPAAGAGHPMAVTRTSVTYIGEPPTAPGQSWRSSAFMWELSRQSVSH